MKIHLRGFLGEMPRVSRAKLPEGFAQTAINTKLWAREIEPFKAPRRHATLDKTGTKISLFKYAGSAGNYGYGDAEVVNQTPVRINANDHGMSTGARVFVGGTGLSIDDEIYTISIISANAFTLNGTSAAGSSSTGYWERQNGFWFHWIDDVDAANGPIGDEDRVYYTGDGVPKMTYNAIATSGGGQSYPNNSYTLGVPAPVSAATITPGAGGGCNAADEVTTTYVYTYVSALGEESAPSPASALQTYCPGQTLSLSGMSTGPAGNYNIATKRIYRLAVGGTQFRLVGEIAVATSTYDDDTSVSPGDPIITAFPAWEPPPDDMHSLKFLPNGIGVGASGKYVYFSVTEQPHAWPVDYRLPCDFNIIGIGTFDANVAVLTEGVPYLITGADPSAMTMAKFTEFEQSCVSKRGIVGLDGFGVIYPTPDGLAVVSVSGPRMLTSKYFTRDEWQALNPQTITAFAHDGRYFGFFSGGGGFIFDPRDEGAGYVQLTPSCTGGFKDLIGDNLYLIIGGYVERWDASDDVLLATWKSPLLRTPHPANFGFLQVYADNYDSITAKIYADEVLKHTVAIASSRPVRLPAGFKGDNHELQFEVDEPTRIRDAILAENAGDLRAI